MTLLSRLYPRCWRCRWWPELESLVVESVLSPVERPGR